MKVRRLKSDCCGMKVGEVYEVAYHKQEDKECHYIQCRLPNGKITTPHWTAIQGHAPYFEIVDEQRLDPWTTPVPLGPEHGFNYPKIEFISNPFIPEDKIIFLPTNYEIQWIQDFKEHQQKLLGMFAIPEAVAAICSCGGKIDTHKPECPENKTEELQDLSSFYYFDESPKRYLGMSDRKKCECGSESVGGQKHSAYCPKFKED